MEAYLHLQPAMEFGEIASALGISKQGAHSLYMSGMRKLRSRRLQPARDELSRRTSRRMYARRSRQRRAVIARWD